MVELKIMATYVYNSKNVTLLDGTELEITPLKIKYLREFMEEFEGVKSAKDDDESISVLMKCVQICMKQFYPKISNTVEEVEDNFDLPTVYEVLDVSAGIKINKKSDDTVKDQATSSGESWSELDLAKMESEVFLVGIWKDYKELEMSLSMPELIATLSTRRELQYEEKKFLAAIQGINLDEQDGKGQDEWERMKARVFSGGATNDGNDVLSLQGPKAKQLGFGIGMGLDYENITN